MSSALLESHSSSACVHTMPRVHLFIFPFFPFILLLWIFGLQNPSDTPLLHSQLFLHVLIIPNVARFLFFQQSPPLSQLSLGAHPLPSSSPCSSSLLGASSPLQPPHGLTARFTFPARKRGAAGEWTRLHEEQ